MCDRAHRCASAQRQAFNLLICAAQRNRKDGNHNLDLLTREGALTRLALVVRSTHFYCNRYVMEIRLF